MKPIEILQGKWLGHPLHPALVHIPVGAWLAACIIDVIARATSPDPGLARLALYLVAAGLGLTLLAVPTGIADWAGIKREKPAWKLGLYHMIGSAVAALLWAVNLVLRIRSLDTVEPITAPILVTSLAGTLVLVASAYLGKLMVYDHGINVARLSKKKWRALAERGGSAVPPEEKAKG